MRRSISLYSRHRSVRLRLQCSGLARKLCISLQCLYRFERWKFGKNHIYKLVLLTSDTIQGRRIWYRGRKYSSITYCIGDICGAAPGRLVLHLVDVVKEACCLEIVKSRRSPVLVEEIES